MHPMGVASAAWVFGASKTPFYVAGALLVCWAVGIALIGLTHPDFPRSPAQARLVVLTSTLLVATTLGMAVLTAGGEHARAAPTAAAGNRLALTADPSGRPAYDSRSATVGKGRTEILLVNRSPTPHDVTIAQGSKVVARTKTITDATASATADLPPGDYTFYCSVDAHRQLGMQGALTVR